SDCRGWVTGLWARFRPIGQATPAQPAWTARRPGPKWLVRLKGLTGGKGLVGLGVIVDRAGGMNVGTARATGGNPARRTMVGPVGATIAGRAGPTMGWATR